jgi:hypothetical protein
MSILNIRWRSRSDVNGDAMPWWYTFKLKKFCLLLSFCACASQSSGQSVGDQISQKAAEANLDFRLATEIVPSGDIQLANGKPVNVADWPTLVVAQIPVGIGKDGKQKLATCTATLVGPTVVLMAAHCVDNAIGAKPRVASLRIDGRKLALNCEIHPDYLMHDPQFISPRGSEDYALCLLDDKGVLPATLASMSFDVVRACPDDRLRVFGPSRRKWRACMDQIGEASSYWGRAH